MSTINVDVLLVGGGVMSATLGTMLMQLDPNLKVALVERLDHVAHESTDGWNNAGTGHAGYCELNYTPVQGNGHVDVKRALAINADHPKALEMAGSAAYGRRDFAAAARYWQRLRARLAESTPARAALDAAIVRAEQLAATSLPAAR